MKNRNGRQKIHVCYDLVGSIHGNTFMTDMNKPCSAFRPNFSTVSDEKTETVIRILGDTLKKIMKKKDLFSEVFF